MDNNFKTSFIPKKPVVTDERPTNPGVSIFTLISVLLLVISLGFAFLAFFYQKSSAQKLVDDKIALAKSKEAFVPGTIEELIRLDSRIEVGKELLNKHTIMSPIFSMLEKKTINTIQFRRFSVSYGEGGAFLIDLSGVAPKFDQIAQQSDEFSKSDDLRDIVFSNLSVGVDGRVSFSVKARVLPSILSYVGQVTAAQKAQVTNQ